MIEFKRDIYEDILKWKNDAFSKKVLFVKGARQIGKTHVINNFVDNHFKDSIRINLMTEDKEDLRIISEQIQQERIEGTLDRRKVNSNHELFRRFSKNFVDSEDFVIVIDEIQEDYKIFNKIREFAREFKARFIVTGSYLGATILREEYNQSAGDTVSLFMTPMTFPEFITACGKSDLYNNLDLYGKSSKSDYDEISKYYNDYLIVGGYPESVDRYLTLGKVSGDYYNELVNTIFEESRKYFNLQSIGGNLVDYSALEACVFGVTKLLLKDKKGINKGDYVSELKRIGNEHTLKLTEKNWTQAIAWLQRAGLIDGCCKVVDFKFDEKLFNQRYYFNDVGLSNYLFNKYNEKKGNESEIMELVNKTFVFNEIRRTSIPNFALYNQSELDFVYYHKTTKLIYGIEVKSGKNKGATIEAALHDKKIDKALYCKGNTYGGIDGDRITIPIYLFPRFNFEK